MTATDFLEMRRVNWSEHFKKDIAYHAATAHEYDAVVVDSRECFNELVFAGIEPLIGPGNAMLDLGCGTGHSIRRFGNRFKTVLGVDHSREMLGRARANLSTSGGHAALIRQDAFEFLPSLASEFDLITAIGFLHHLPPHSIPTLLAAIRQNLANNGLLLLAEPIAVDLSQQPSEVIEWNARSVMAKLQFSAQAEEADEAPLDQEALMASLAQEGFETIQTFRGWELFPHHVPADDEDRRQIARLHARHGSNGNVLCLLLRKP
jgi:SAM-dependent methyltransferase